MPVLQPRTVGVVVESVLAHGRGILKGIAAYGLGAGWRYRKPGLWVVSPEPEVSRWQVDGLIAAVHTEAMQRVVMQLGVPTVDTSGLLVGSSIPSVVTDDAAIGQIAAAHLLDCGITGLAFVGERDRLWSDQRQRAFVAAAAGRGIGCHVFSGDALAVPSRRQRDDSPLELRTWLAALPASTGVFAANDRIAEAVLRAARDVGRSVPEELAVIGVDDDEMVAPMTSPPLSSIDPNTYRIGLEAARLLDTMMSGATPPAAPICVPPIGVVARASSDILAIADTDVAAAVRFIRERANVSMSVADVIAAIPLSRRPLEKRFRRVLGRSILGEIHRVHVERARQLLVATDLPMPQIARASGFSTATRLGIVFRLETGMTPSEFRLQFRRRR